MTSNTDRLINNLERMNPLRQGTLGAAINALHLPPGSRGLDIGCGIGDQALLLADAIRPDGHVTGLDISWPLLDYAGRKTSRPRLKGCLTFEQGDLKSLPFASDAFDWAWSADCAGYPSADLLPILIGIRRVVRPGGVIALLAWSSQQLLPGYTMLEARLNVSCSAYAPFLENQPPQAHFQRALHWFRQAGLDDLSCSTFIGQLAAPLSPELRSSLGLLFDMLWGEKIDQASEPDRQDYLRLCSPTSSDFVGDLPEYCGFFIYTMFTGRVSCLH
jgi:ubiquinone/menaquinone biosynthesis C-methylase UbiE